MTKLHVKMKLAFVICEQLKDSYCNAHTTTSYELQHLNIHQHLTMDVIFRLRRWTSKPTWRYFLSAMVGQKVKLHEYYFQSTGDLTFWLRLSLSLNFGLSTYLN